MTATDTHERTAAFWYALGRLDALDVRDHPGNIDRAQAFAAKAVHHTEPIPDLYRSWRTGVL